MEVLNYSTTHLAIMMRYRNHEEETDLAIVMTYRGIEPVTNLILVVKVKK